MSALTIAKEAGKDAVLAKIAEANLYEYGLMRERLADRIGSAAEGSGVEVGLNNADTDHVLLSLLKETPEKIFDGAKVAAFLNGSEAVRVYLPENETALLEELKEKADAAGVELVSDIINVRECEGHLLLHLATAADLADLVEGNYVTGVYVSKDGKSVEKAADDTKLSEVVSLDGAKAVWTGYTYYTPEEAQELTALDATNGVVRVLGEKDCMVQEALKQLHTYREVSCGRCVFCREGLIQLEYEQKETTEARGKMEYLDLAKEIGEPMRFSSLCSVGQKAPETALSAVSKFAGEFESHIKKNQCPAGVCSSFEHIYIDPQACNGCGECMDVCEADCIEGKAKFIHMIDEFDCTKCGKCIEVCEEEAIIKTSGKLPKLPNRLTKVGRFKKH